MSNKITLKLSTAIYFLVGALVIGFGVRWLLFEPRPGTDQVSGVVPETTIVHHWHTDTTVKTDTFDHFILTPGAHFGEIPINHYNSLDTLFVKNNHVKIAIPIHRRAIVRGMMYSDSLWTDPTPYEVTLPVPKEPIARFYGEIGFWANPRDLWRVSGRAECGILVKKRVGFGVVGIASNYSDWKVEVGIKACW